MANLNKHKEQAQHNEKLALQLGDGEYRDWSVTCLFYAALHILEAALLSNPRVSAHSEDLFENVKQALGPETEERSLHAFRERLVNANYPEVKTQYSQLRHMSESVRYIQKSGNKCGYEYITSETAKQAVKYLNDIKSGVK